MDYRDVLRNPRPIRRECSIVWDRFTGARIPKVVTLDVLAELQTSRDYSFQHIDGSIFQLHYRFSPDCSTLIGANLAFVKNLDPEESLGDEDSLSESDEVAVVPDTLTISASAERACAWVRIDFAPTSRKQVVHEDCHLHLCGFKETRIACKRVPTPRQFVESMLAWFYPKWYEDVRLPQANTSGRVWYSVCRPVLGATVRPRSFIPGLHLNV